LELKLKAFKAMQIFEGPGVAPSESAALENIKVVPCGFHTRTGYDDLREYLHDILTKNKCENVIYTGLLPDLVPCTRALFNEHVIHIHSIFKLVN
jgi:hypothetical protein